MNPRTYQVIFELTAVGLMVAGIILMWLQLDPKHFLVYAGFATLATGKVIETLNTNDPNFRIIRLAACGSIYMLVILNLFYNVRSLMYVLIPLGAYYALHYRWIYRQRSHE